jgi:hypothetical protein
MRALFLLALLLALGAAQKEPDDELCAPVVQRLTHELRAKRAAQPLVPPPTTFSPPKDGEEGEDPSKRGKKPTKPTPKDNGERKSPPHAKPAHPAKGSGSAPGMRKLAATSGHCARVETAYVCKAVSSFGCAWIDGKCRQSKSPAKAPPQTTLPKPGVPEPSQCTLAGADPEKCRPLVAVKKCTWVPFPAPRQSLADADSPNNGRKLRSPSVPPPHGSRGRCIDAKKPPSGDRCFDHAQNSQVKCAALVKTGRCVFEHGKCTVAKKLPTTTTTRRISYWSGKVNQRFVGGAWKTDPDGTSGASIPMLTYCRKWWPDTVSVKKLGHKEKITFYTRGNKVAHTSTKDVFECVAASDKKPRMCCKAMTAQCLACAKGVTPLEYCKASPSTIGCKPNRPPPTTPTDGCFARAGNSQDKCAALVKTGRCVFEHGKCTVAKKLPPTLPARPADTQKDWCFAQAGESKAKCAPLVKAKKCVFKYDKCIKLESNTKTTCCVAFTATCLACAKGVTPSEYCKGRPQTVGCKKVDGQKGMPWDTKVDDERASWAHQCRSQALKKIYPSSIRSEFRVKRGDGTPMLCTRELAQTVVKTAIVKSIGATLLMDATVDVTCGGSGGGERSDRRLNKEDDKEVKAEDAFVYTIFGSKKAVQDIVVSTGALDEDNAGVSFASKVATELREQDGDAFQDLEVESVGKAAIAESEPTIFVFDEPEKSSQDEENVVPEKAEHVETEKDSKQGSKTKEQGSGLDSDGDDDADLSSVLQENQDKEGHNGHRDGEKQKHFPWFFVVGGVCGMAALAVVLMYVGYSMATKRKHRRESIRMGTVVIDAEGVMPVSVVLPQEMGRCVSARRPTWSTTLEGGTDKHAFATVVQHE